MIRPHLPRQLSLRPLSSAIHIHMPERMTTRLRPFEPLLRICQLVMIVLFAVLGAQWAAKVAVRAGSALMSLIH